MVQSETQPVRTVFIHSRATIEVSLGITGVGVAVLLANWTNTDSKDKSFSTAAKAQLDYLLETAPRTDDGAISHRGDQVQLWYVLFPTLPIL